MNAGERDSQPAITVVLAAYNAEAFITRAIESVQAQSFHDWELICIDDGSTDNTQEIIRGFSKRDHRIKLIVQENSGPAEARRKGYVSGVGQYYASLDADDWLGTNALETLLREAEESGADAVVARVMLYDSKNREWSSFHQRHGTPQAHQFSGHEAFALTFPWRIHANGCLWRKHLIKEHAIDATNAFNKFNADEFLTRVLFLNCDKVFMGSGEYFFFENPGSLTQSHSSRQFMRLETDRRLTDLAVSTGLDGVAVRKVLKTQRQHLLGSISSFVRDGGDGKTKFVLREIRKSFGHYIRTSSRHEDVWAAGSILLAVPVRVLRGYLSRFSSLRKTYYKIRFPS